MPIELTCPSCQKLLRVPDGAAGKNARCPMCQAIVKVPSPENAGQDLLAPPPQSAWQGTPPEPKPAANPLSDPYAFGSPPETANPYADKPRDKIFGGPDAGGFGGGSGGLNPYASPAGGFNEPRPIAGPIGNQRVELGPILNYASRVWQDNLGLLVGTTVVFAIVSIGIQSVASVIVGVIMVQIDQLLAAFVGLVLQLLMFAVQTYLGIGVAQMHLKMARRLPVDFSEMFLGAQRFVPVFCLMLIVNGPNFVLQAINGALGPPGRGNEFIALGVSLAMLLWGLALLIGALFFWPAYYLVLEERASVLDSFGLAARVTEGNRLTSFVLFLLIFGIVMLGCLALCIGLLFAVPLTQLLLSVAYLMMSAQLRTDGSRVN